MLDPNLYLLLTTVIVSVIGIVVPLATLWVKYQQDKKLAATAVTATNEVAVKVEAVRQGEVEAAAKVRDVAIALDKDRVAWEHNQDRTDSKLNIIYTLVDGRLTHALEMIEELKVMLQALAPNDPRVQKLVSQEPP